MIINLPKDLEKETTHRYGPNSFKLHRWACAGVSGCVRVRAGAAQGGCVGQRGGSYLHSTGVGAACAGPKEM